MGSVNYGQATENSRKHIYSVCIFMWMRRVDVGRGRVTSAGDIRNWYFCESYHIMVWIMIYMYIYISDYHNGCAFFCVQRLLLYFLHSVGSQLKNALVLLFRTTIVLLFVQLPEAVTTLPACCLMIPVLILTLSVVRASVSALSTIS